MPREGKCYRCDGSEKLRKQRKTGRLICRKCVDLLRYYDTSTYEKCSICPKVGRVAIRYEGNPICDNCYREYFAKRQNCQVCNRFEVLSFYKKHGKKVCNTCRGRLRSSDVTTYEECFVCHQPRSVATRNIEGFPVCYSCYNSKKRLAMNN